MGPPSASAAGSSASAVARPEPPVASLVLLNGPPSVGKSTIAELYVSERSLALKLDIDVVRGLLGRWIEQPLDAGLLARDIARAMAVATLRAGHDVIVPQYVARVEFIDELAATAAECEATFVEVVLMADKQRCSSDSPTDRPRARLAFIATQRRSSSDLAATRSLAGCTTDWSRS